MPRKPKETYTTLAGEVLEYPHPKAETARFLARVHDATNNPAVSESSLLTLIYSKENPILDQTIFPARGAVTAAVFRNPVYHVMLDLLDHKRVQTGTLNLEREHDRYTMTVPEAAAELGITESSVRVAIKSKRLAAIKPAGSYRLDPTSVAEYEVSSRGPKR